MPNRRYQVAQTRFDHVSNFLDMNPQAHLSCPVSVQLCEKMRIRSLKILVSASATGFNHNEVDDTGTKIPEKSGRPKPVF